MSLRKPNESIKNKSKFSYLWKLQETQSEPSSFGNRLCLWYVDHHPSIPQSTIYLPHSNRYLFPSKAVKHLGIVLGFIQKWGTEHPL